MVTLNVSDTPPIVSIAFVVMELIPEEVCRTLTVLPLFTVPLELVYVPLLLISYVPPVIEMVAAVSIPETVIVFDVITVLSATLV